MLPSRGCGHVLPILGQLTLVVPLLAQLAVIVRHTVAARSARLHQAQSAIPALHSVAPDQLLRAIRAGESQRTGARVARQLVDADRPVLARRRLALVHVQLAVPAAPASRALARVLHAHAVDALAAVQAQAANAALADGHVHLAVHAQKADGTVAVVAVFQVDAGSAVAARIRLALVDVHVAIGACASSGWISQIPRGTTYVRRRYP